ncbi:MAG: dihydroorotase family protein [Parvibaculaceae bacterium]
MPKLDLALRGGKIFIEGRLIEGHIGIRNEKIVAVTTSDGGMPDAKQEIDAHGRVILPGVIDMHVHCRDLDHAYKETFTTATRAAAAGGVTLVCDMPNCVPPTTTAQRYREKIALAEPQVYVDYSIWGGGVDTDEIGNIAAEGAIGYKIYMHTSAMKGTPHHRGVFVEDDGQLYDIFRAVEKTGLPLMIHLDNQAISERLRQKLVAEGRNSALDYMEPWETIAMEEATQKVLLFSQKVGTRIHIAHAPNPASVELARSAKQKGVPVTVEVIAPYLFLSYDDAAKLGPYAVPVSKPQDQIDAYWTQLLDRGIDTIGTDHAPHTKEEKEVGWKNIWDAAPGVTSIETYLGLLLDKVAAGKLSLARMVELTSQKPAEILGFPHKGHLRPGADADLTVVDLDKEWVVDNAKLETKPKWDPFAGRKLRGKPVMTIVRGRPVMADGVIIGPAGWGTLQKPARN